MPYLHQTWDVAFLLSYFHASQNNICYLFGIPVRSPCLSACFIYILSFSFDTIKFNFSSRKKCLSMMRLCFQQTPYRIQIYLRPTAKNLSSVEAHNTNLCINLTVLIKESRTLTANAVPHANGCVMYNSVSGSSSSS